MQTGWQEIDGTWYYLNASGAMQTNCWVKQPHGFADKEQPIEAT